MRAVAKVIVNIAATGGLAIWVLTWIAWVPGAPAATTYLTSTGTWRSFGAAIAWLRLFLGATVGPESDELMLVQCDALISLVLAIAIVWAANRAFRRITRPRHHAAASRAAGAVP